MSDDDPFESKEWQEFARHVIEETLPKMQRSDMTISLVPKGPADIKFTVELGLSIMLDKPIIAIVLPGTQVPEHLIRVADRIVEGDMDDPDFARRISQVIAEIEETLPKDEG